MNEHRGRHKRAYFLYGILITSIGMGVLGWIEKETIYQDHTIQAWKEPYLSFVFQGCEEGRYPWKMNESSDDVRTIVKDQESLETIKVAQSKEENSKEKITKENIENLDEKNVPIIVRDIKEDDEKTKKKKEKEETLGLVEMDYFDDALFIGDSRTVGLWEYSYLTNATFYCDVGLSVYTIFDKKIVKNKGKEITIEEALQKRSFGKIYIMLGVNELGTGNAQTFAKKYQSVLERIRDLQPDATIFVQAIMNLTKEKSDHDEIYNNENISSRNEELKRVATEGGYIFLDVNPELTDEEGYLPEEHTFDGVHLLAKYYNDWADFLKGHGMIE